MPEQIKKQVNELCEIVKAVQTKNTENEKKYDGLLNEQIHDLSEKSSKLAENLQELKGKEDDQQKRIITLENALAKKGNGVSESEKSEYHDAFAAYLRKGVAIDPKISVDGLKSLIKCEGMTAEEIQAKTMQVGINPQGGYWVIPQRISKVVGRVFETSPMRDVANVITTASDSVEMIIDDEEAASSRATETSTRSQTNAPDIGLLSIFTHMYYAEPKVTQKLLDDAGFDVSGWLNNKIRRKIGRQQNTDYVSGNGADKAKGFLDYSAWTTDGTYERNKLEQLSSGGATTITADGLIELQNALIEDYQMNANWMMRRQTWGQILKLKTSGTGDYLLDPQLLRNGEGALVLLGNPVKFASDMPAIAASSLSVAYGDFKEGYTIVDKVGAIAIRDNITDKGRVKFYLELRSGGAVTNYESIKILKTEA